MDERELTRNEVHACGLPTRERWFPFDEIQWFEGEPHAPENTPQPSADDDAQGFVRVAGNRRQGAR